VAQGLHGRSRRAGNSALVADFANQLEAIDLAISTMESAD